MTLMPSKDYRRHRFSQSLYHGDGLGVLGVPEDGVFTEDREAEPRVGDLVHCAKMQGSLSSYMMQIESITPDKDIIVRSRNKDKNKDFSFIAAELFGVIVRIEGLSENVTLTRENILNAV